jgi:CDP-paratose 2-epimerase
VTDRLLGHGHAVTVLDDLSRPGAELNLAWLRERHGSELRFVGGDVRDAATVAEAARGADVIYHLAGQTAVTVSTGDPRGDFEANALGTLNVLEAARRSREAPVVVYASTNKVYGALEDVPVVAKTTRYTFRDLPNGVSEEQPLAFNSPYACSKGVGDQYAVAYARLYGVRAIVLRQSCVYGPRQMGVEDQGWVAWFVLAAATGRPITICGDGRQVRDLLFVDDLVTAYDAAVEHVERTAGNAYNIGGGPERTLSVWAEFQPLLEEVLGRPVDDVAFAPWRAGDQRVFFCDTARARRDFGWQPEVGVRDGIARLADWILANARMLAKLVRP